MSPELLAAAKLFLENNAELFSGSLSRQDRSNALRFVTAVARAAIAQHEEIERLKKQIEDKDMILKP